jgi:hydroxymethylpyrimidine/phosphomethylpyrimidine kinase
MTISSGDPSSNTPSTAQEACLPCVVTFNVNDPSGAGGLSADLTAMASAGCHVLPVVTGTYVRDTRQVHHHLPLDEDAIDDQARCALEDMAVQTVKVGFAASAEALSTIAEILSDYSDIPVVSYMPELAWWDEVEREHYLDAFAELVLPQTSVLVGNHNTLCRWLLPDWSAARPPGPRDVAKAAAEHGVPYTLVTGFNAPDQHLESHLASPEAVLATARYERFEATFTGAGDTLSAALAALLANENDLQAACAEALTYLDQCLDAGFHPGMGHAVPDRLFWAHDDADDTDDTDGDAAPTTTPAHRLADFPTDSNPH